MNYYENGIIPFFGKGELSTESFSVSQYDNTYLLAAPRYRQFYQSYIRPRILMYHGWITGFHNVEYGLLPTLFLQRIGNGIKNTLFAKQMVLNSENPDTTIFVADKKFIKSNFNNAVLNAFDYALSGGTGLIKINCDENKLLRYESVPMDKFFVEVDAYGDIQSVKSFIATYHNTINSNQEYYLCEERFFRTATIGTMKKRYPMVHYTYYKTSSNIIAEHTPEPVKVRDVPVDIRKKVENDYGKIIADDWDGSALSFREGHSRSDSERSTVYQNCTLLPFDDDLGCRLVKFTSSIPAFPTLPFGQPIADMLMSESYAYDQLKFFEKLETYLSRGRIMIDEGQANPNDPDARKKALDPMVFTFYDNVMNDSKDGKPMGIQLDLRAEAIRTQKQNILNDTAFALNLSSSTIAAWLSDGTSQKTATEIEYERTKTDSFISSHIELIRQPLQDLIDLQFHYYGKESPKLNIMPEEQVSRSDNIRLYSELYDKNQVTAKMLAEKILGTCSVKEVMELAEHIETQRIQAQPLNQPPVMGLDDSRSEVDI